MHCSVYKCSNRQNSAAKENGIIFFIFPKDVKKRKSWVKAVNRTDWSPHEIFSNFIMFGSFVDGWHSHSVSDDPVFSYNEKYRTDWICRWLICPLFCQHAINLEKLQVFLKYSWQRSWRKKLLWTHSAMNLVCYDFFYPSTDNTKIWHSSLVVFRDVSRGIKKNLNKPLWWTYNIS